MIFSSKRNKLLIFILLLFFLTSSCTPMIGRPSLTLMTQDLKTDSSKIELIGDSVVEESETLYWFMFCGMAGQHPGHESVVSRLLEKHNADLLLDSELYTSNYGIPYIFMTFNTTVKGRPARIKEGGYK